MMINRHFMPVIVLLLLAAPPLWASDWNQWRGPLRTGVAPDEPALLETWPEGGPEKLWDSETWSGSSGYSCPVVADGRVYVLVNWRYKEPMVTRILTKAEMKAIGCYEEKPEGELLEKIEAARTSEELASLDRKKRDTWIKEWMKANLSGDETKKYGSFVRDRLRRVEKALPFEVLDKLLAIKNREFATEADLAAWLDEQGIASPHKEAILQAFPTEARKANDTLLCMNDADGSTAWKFAWEGLPENRKSCSTPCVAGGRCFIAGSTGMICCIDAVEGKEIWKSDVAAEKAEGVNSSAVVVGDTMYILAGALTAFDAATGEVKWRREEVSGRDTSPTPWDHEGAQYLLCNTNKNLYCVEAATGKVMWSTKSANKCSPTVSGTRALICRDSKDGNGFICYEITPSAAKELWKAPLTDGYVSPVVLGEYAYATGEKKAMCVELASGKVLWNVDIGTDKCASPAVADGALFNVKKGAVVMARFTPEGCELRGTLKSKVLQYTSPTLANGRLYLKMNKNISCYRVGAAQEAAATDEE